MDRFIQTIISAACKQAGVDEETLNSKDRCYLEEVFEFSKELAFRRLSKIALSRLQSAEINHE